MNIGTRIKLRRQLLNMTLEEVAKRIGLTRQTVQRYECGVISNIPSDKIELLATALQTTPAYLMGWEEPTPALELTDKERRLVESYRNNPAMQSAVDRLLGITDTSGTAATLADDLAQEINALQSTRHTATKQN